MFAASFVTLLLAFTARVMLALWLAPIPAPALRGRLLLQHQRLARGAGGALRLHLHAHGGHAQQHQQLFPRELFGTFPCRAQPVRAAR